VRRESSPAVFEAIVILVALAVAAGAGLIGWVVGHEMASASASSATATQAASVPAGHVGGPNLAVSAIGDQAKGAELFESKGCSDCHSFNGQGGEDAPPLDSMMGHLSAREIANMSGDIWNHVPQMIHHFKEEGLTFPTFSDEEMADLIAYLHGGAPAGMGPSAQTGMETGMQMGTETGTGMGTETGSP
jgi:mono/diheme cytochrome c family protein